MWGWFKRKRNPEPPRVFRETIGHVSCRSGTLLLADPSLIFDPVRVEGVPVGRVPVVAELIRYPEGGTRVAMVRLHIRDGELDSRQMLGEVGVDSAKIVVVDARTHEECWKEVGPDRIGHTSGQNHVKIAKLIGKRFGLRHHEVNFISSEFLTPISEELEAAITSYIETLPEYAKFSYIYFRIKTNNTVDRIWAAMNGRNWAEVALGSRPDESLIAVTSGFGDGRYTVESFTRGGELLAVEVRFIGPEQEPILEAFPMLRY
jgi:hypothetical protein